MRSKNIPVRLMIAIVLQVLCFIADLYINPRYPIWLLYFLPLLLVWNISIRSIIAVAILATMLQVTRLIVSSFESRLFLIAWVNRSAEITVIWFFSLISIARLRYMEKLKQQEEQLHRQVQILDQVQDAVIVIDNNTQIKYMNATAYHLYDISPEEPVLGSKLGEFFRFEWQSPQQLKEYTNALRNVGVWKGEKFHITHKGQRFWGESVISLTKDNTGNPTGVVAVVRDITERKSAQLELEESRGKLILANEAANIGTWSIETDTERMDWDTTTRKHWGFSKDEQLNREKLYSHTHPDDRQKLQEALLSITQKVIIYSVEIRVIHPDNSIHYLASTGRALEDNRGHIFRVIGTSLDITDRVKDELIIKQLNEELKMRAQELEYANRELESFSYSVTHDLHSPLRTIIDLGEVFIEEYGDRLDKDGYKLVKQIVSSGNKMNLLIDDILNLSKVTRQELHKEEINLSRIAGVAVAELRRKQPERHVEIRIHEVGKVRADPRLMLIVMGNLIGNSWKYTQKTENAQIEFGSMQKDNEQIYYVRDNGAGFDMKYAENLFIPFKRLHADKDFAGTGIGLSIVKRIIDRHGGKIWAQGEPGKGSVFYFTLGRVD